MADQLCPKRQQGRSSGTYLALAALNRAIHPVGKRHFWEWLARTVLVEEVPGVSAEARSSQRFWNRLRQWEPEKMRTLWKELLEKVSAKSGD